MREIFHVREKSRKQKNHMEDRRGEGKQESSERVKSAGKWESASILTQLNGAVRQRDHAGLAPNQKKKWCTMTGKSGLQEDVILCTCLCFLCIFKSLLFVFSLYILFILLFFMFSSRRRHEKSPSHSGHFPCFSFCNTNFFNK